MKEPGRRYGTVLKTLEKLSRGAFRAKGKEHMLPTIQHLLIHRDTRTKKTVVNTRNAVVDKYLEVYPVDD